jgi:hypothetical protein
MQLVVEPYEERFKTLYVQSRTERAAIESQNVFEMLLLNHAARIGLHVPKQAEDFSFADVAIIFKTLPECVPFGLSGLPIFFNVGEVPTDTSRLYFAFYFPQERQVLLLGGTHVCFAERGDFNCERLLTLVTPEIWFRLRNQPPTFFSLYNYPFCDAFPRPQLLAAVEWRLISLVHGPDSLHKQLGASRSTVEKISTALSWHKKTFEDYDVDMDHASFWVTLAASQAFPDGLFKAWQEAEKWLIRIRACYLCKNEYDFEALIKHELGDPIPLTAFKAPGPRRLGAAGPSDPWRVLPKVCPDRRFKPAYQSNRYTSDEITFKNGKRCARQSVLRELARPIPFCTTTKADEQFTPYFTRPTYSVAHLAAPSVGTTEEADIGDLVVPHTTPRLVYQAPFEDAPDALSERRGVLKHGLIHLPWYYAYEILEARLDKRVEFAHNNQYLERVFDQQVKKIKRRAESIWNRVVSQRYQRMLAQQPTNLSSIDQVSEHLPPCMRTILSEIVAKGRVGNEMRFAFIPFLLKLGYAPPVVSDFLQSIWSPTDWAVGDVARELPGLFKRYEEYKADSSKFFGMGCKGLASRRLCPLETVDLPREYLAGLYDQPVADIEDCADGEAGQRCALVLAWRGARKGKPVSSPQNYVRRSLKS